MKTKLLYFLLALLIITNSVMIFMLIKKPHHQTKGGRDFIVQELQFDKNQRERFYFLDSQHRETMENFDVEIRQSKDVLFNSFSKANFSSDSISKRIGTLEGEKEQEFFTFFREVRKICKPEQASVFDKIIKSALHQKGNKPSRSGERGRGREGHPPPR